MKIDHLVLNIDEKYQNSGEEIDRIRKSGILYEPKFGKGTKGFKATNLWFGREYFEMIHLLREDGGGWIEQWTKMYNEGHRGLVCIFLDVDNIKKRCEQIKSKGIAVTEPEWLKFKWFFNLFTRTMPWMNSYLPFFENLPIQIGFQQMKDEKSRDFMNQYMYPNSKENGIEGISKIIIYGELTKKDLEMLKLVFEDDISEDDGGIMLKLSSNQQIQFLPSETNYVEVITTCSNAEHLGKKTSIENLTIVNQ